MDSNQARHSQLKLVLKLFVELEKQFIKHNNLLEFITMAHHELKSVLNCENFYLARFYANEQTLQFPYFVDETENPVDASRVFNLPSPDESPTAWIICNKKRLYFEQKTDQFTTSKDSQWCQGSKASCWLGFPLIAPSGECIGAVVIQSYQENASYNELEQYIFGLFSGVIANAVIKHDINQQANFVISAQLQALEHKLATYEKDRKLQTALYKISQLTNETTDLYHFYHQVHQIIDSILYAKNFYIALYDEQKQSINLPYFVDINDGRKFETKTLPVGNGLTSYVLNKQQAMRLNKKEVNELITAGEIQNVHGSTEFTMWLAAPLKHADQILGVIVVQSYSENVLYSAQDLDLLKFVANHVANALVITQQKIIQEHDQAQLAQQQQLLETQNEQLYNAFRRLKSTQEELLQQEKMASLGELVAGVAHEINTPLGVCVTALSHLDEIYQTFKSSYLAGRVTKKQMDSLISTMDESLRIISSNSERAANLIHSFKQVAVDQTSDDVRTIKLAQYLQEIIVSLKPKFKNTPHQIQVECDNRIELTTKAGAIAQIFTNLITNSLLHGFEQSDCGLIQILITDKLTQIEIIFFDNGKGVSEEQLKKLFNPFFTTKRGYGGSGLGTHIVYNLVTSSLKGKIQANHHSPQGLEYKITIPKIL